MRKQKAIRFALTEEVGEDFQELKRKAEDELAASLTDAQYAAMLIKWAINRKKPKLD